MALAARTGGRGACLAVGRGAGPGRLVAMDAIARLLANPGDLPVRGALPEVRAAVERAGVAVLTAPPGSGKTTLVPPLLADIVRAGAGVGAGSRARAGAGAGRIVVTQPRRIAARAAARRLASLLGQEVGGDVGVTVRGESRTSPRTRVEVVTTGVLLRRLQRDPALPGVAGVVLDEVHERSLESDLVLAMVADVRETLREDLRVVVMSATLDAAALGAAWDAPVVVADGALHEVDTVWCPPERPLVRSDERGVRREYLQHVIAVARRAVAERAGDVLVFVPGAREVDDVVAGLRRAPLGGLAGAEDTADGRRSEEPEVLPLHGRLPAAAQDRALRAGGRRRVVVSTAVAESSLTVPGVRVVVDAGLARQPRTDHRRGLAGLVTVMVSRAGAEQRAGRAGREGPGAVYRCWSEAEHARLAPFAEPEVATADLASFVLEAACWSRDGVAGLRLTDAPPRAALEAAEEVLRGLSALDGDGVVTARGRAIAGVPTDPRLARALLDGAASVGPRAAAEVVALLAEDLRAPGGDLSAAWRAARGGGAGTEWARTRDRLLAVVQDAGGGADVAGDAAVRDAQARDTPRVSDAVVAEVVALAHPDRLARRRAGSTAYLMASGSGAVLGEGSALVGQEWLAVADADRSRGRDALIRSGVPIDEAAALAAGAALVREEVDVAVEGTRVVASRVRRLGAIPLSSVRLSRVGPEGAAALRAALRRSGVGVLRWTEAARGLRARLAFLHRELGPPWPDVGDDALAERVQEWLPDGTTDLARVDVLALLRGLLPWPDAAHLDELAPERIALPSGRFVRVEYGADQPVIASRVQDFFGMHETPRLAGGRVPVVAHLLSPAGRPAAITADLAGFWDGGYAAVRADLRGRYPKHAWPERP